MHPPLPQGELHPSGERLVCLFGSHNSLTPMLQQPTDPFSVLVLSIRPKDLDHVYKSAQPFDRHLQMPIWCPVRLPFLTPRGPHHRSYWSLWTKSQIKDQLHSTSWTTFDQLHPFPRTSPEIRSWDQAHRKWQT